MKYIIGLFFTLVIGPANAQVTRTRVVKLMGSRWDITIVATDSAAAEHIIDTVTTEVTRIENLISDWKPASQIGQVNSHAGISPIVVDKEVFDLTKRAIRFSKLTGGAFDISFAAMDRIWKFDGSMDTMPTPDAVKKSVAKVGYQNIVLDSVHSTIYLKLPGMKIGFGALGEGYAADRCRNMLRARGVDAGIINGSGDMSTWGRQPNGQRWNIGITDPFSPGDLYAVVPLQQSAVTTSGSYEKYVEFGGKRYSHIINPATGYPATGLSSVTVFGPDAEMCNGFSTSIMVLGKTAGFRLLQQFPQYRCIMVSDDKQFYASKGIDLKKFRVKKDR